MERFSTEADGSLTPAANIEQLEPSYMWQAARAVTQYVRAHGKVPDWFGPGAPLPPIAPKDISGRQFDFPTAYNTVNQPKFGEGVPFHMLRTFSRCYDIQRMVIETCKNRICKLEWGIVYKDTKKKPDDRCKAITDFFSSPDKEHTWQTWLRMLLEDMYVLDAATLYPRMARDGSLYAMDPMDGATIKRVLDDYGRTPMPPYPAYQQRLKGVAALDYTRDELIYMPRNPSTDRVYGLSHVEQVIVTVNIALRRQAHQLQYYTDGTVPDLILSVPGDWNTDQLKAFEDYWNSKLLGNTAARRGTKFVFDGTTAINTKDAVLQDKMDEWLARVICFCFGISSQPFTYAVNRATAETAAEMSKEDGDGPVMDWVRGLVDNILTKYFASPDLCFKWKEEDEVAPEVKAKIRDTRLRNGSMSINEYRASEGEDPIEGGDDYLIYTAQGAVTLEQAKEPPAPPPNLDPSGVAFGGAEAPPKKDEAKKEDVEKAAPHHVLLSRAIGNTLSGMVAEIARQVGELMQKKDEDEKAKALRIIKDLDFSGFGKAAGIVQGVLESAAKKGGVDGLYEVGVSTGDDLFDIVPDVAAKFAESRAGELLSSDADGGMLGDSTRLLIRGTITEALEQGWSIDELTDALRSSYAFSEDRAEVIADYELRNAINQGELQTWSASGVVSGKEWLLSNDEGICPICEANAAQGEVEIGGVFDSGDTAPPAHPNCRCSLAPVVTTDADDGEE